MMKSKYKPYPKYRSSGVEWIGEIPEGWEEKRFCFLFTFTKGLSITKEDLLDEGIPCVNYGEIHSRLGFEVDPKKHKLNCVKNEYLQSNQKAVLKRGDFVFADTSEDIEGSGNFTYLNSDAITFAGYHTIIAKPKKNTESRYIAYFFDSIPFRTQIRSEVAGIKVYSITKSILKDTIVILPPLLEQKAIASFLDREMERINSIIAKQARMIELLKEKRSALITEAVTKGIDTKAKMKPSGVEWIGEIPKGWDVVRFKQYYSFEKGKNSQLYTNEYIRENEGDYPVYSGQTENNGVMGAVKKYEYDLSEEAILITTVGAKAMTHSLISGKFSLSQNIALIKKRRIEYHTRFIYYFLFPLIEKEKGSIALIMQPSLRFEDLNKYYTLLPPLPEQNAIVSFLDFEMEKIDSMVKNIEKQIELLNEYKQSLISHAVTGKINVSTDLNIRMRGDANA